MATRKSHRAPTRSTVRAACDRCHETKSRCARAMGSFECERCNRLGNICAYSPALPMGRPKALSQSSASLPREYAHTYSHRTQAEWKKHKRAAQRTSDSVQFGNDNHNLPSPPLSASNVTDSARPVISVGDSQQTISDSWLPADWPTGEFDLDCMMQSDFSPPSDHSATFSGTASNQFHNTSFSALPTSVSTSNPTSDSDWGVPSNPISSHTDPADEKSQEESQHSSDTYESTLHQLLRLKSDLYQITSHASVSNSSSHPLSEDQFAPESFHSALAKTGMPSLDMILGCTQTLIDILQLAPSSPSPVPQTHGSSTRTSHADSQAYPPPTNNNTRALHGRPHSSPDIATTLLSLSCYSSLLVAYDGIVGSLLSLPNNPNDKSIMQVPPSSPSLKFGTFSMTARSTLFVSTVLHVVKQMLEQLQGTFQTRFSLPSNVSEVATSSGGIVHSTTQINEEYDSPSFRSPVISAALAVLVEISQKEKRLMEVLAAKG